MPNGSFEDTIQCPNNQGQVNLAKHWFDPTFTSSDYFNSCCSNGIAGVPLNFYGYKNAIDGSGMMGLVTYHSTLNNYREYISVKLTEKLDSNVTYCFSCFISPSGSWARASNGFGFYLTQDTLGIYNYYFKTINHSPTFVDSSINTDTINWKKIEFLFLNQTQNLQFLVLGNFYDDVKVATSIINHNAIDISYYYIDKVELVKCEEIFVIIPNVMTANNDGINDVFKIIGLPKNSQLSIFNRWGNQIYYSNDYQNDWSAFDVSAGTYYYLIKTETKTYKGFLEIFK